MVILQKGVKNFNIEKIPKYMKFTTSATTSPSTPTTTPSSTSSTPSPSTSSASSASKPLVNIGNTTNKFFCTLCRKNGEPSEVYSSHNIKTQDGKVTCPVLRKYTCSLCGATGENAHTKTHCPQFVDAENVQLKPKYRIMSNGKSTLMLKHK